MQDFPLVLNILSVPLVQTASSFQ